MLGRELNQRVNQFGRNHPNVDNLGQTSGRLSIIAALIVLLYRVASSDTVKGNAAKVGEGLLKVSKGAVKFVRKGAGVIQSAPMPVKAILGLIVLIVVIYAAIRQFGENPAPVLRNDQPNPDAQGHNEDVNANQDNEVPAPQQGLPAQAPHQVPNIEVLQEQIHNLEQVNQQLNETVDALNEENKALRKRPPTGRNRDRLFDKGEEAPEENRNPVRLEK